MDSLQKIDLAIDQFNKQNEPTNGERYQIQLGKKYYNDLLPRLSLNEQGLQEYRYFIVLYDPLLNYDIVIGKFHPSMCKNA